MSEVAVPASDPRALERVNILTREFKRDPYPFYARLRAERPVCYTRVGAFDAYLVTRYDDVVAVLKDPRFAKDRFRVLTPEQLRRQPWIPKFVLPLTRNMLDLDDPEHARLRNLVHKALLERLSGLRLAVPAASLRWRTTPVLRGLEPYPWSGRRLAPAFLLLHSEFVLRPARGRSAGSPGRQPWDREGKRPGHRQLPFGTNAGEEAAAASRRPT